MNQGEIWLVSLDPTIRAEIRKTRPAIIINDNLLGKLPLKIVVPLTDWKDHYIAAPWMVKVSPDAKNNLTKYSSADCFQIRSIAEARCIRKIGEVDIKLMNNIRKALAIILNIE